MTDLSEDDLGVHDTSPWPAFADLLAATTLLFLILFAVVALPALVRNRSAVMKESTLRALRIALAPDSNAAHRFSVDTIGDYLLVRIPEKATFPRDSSSISSFQPAGRAILEEVAGRIKQRGLDSAIDQIQVVGHTSSEGDDAHNWQLSSSRATSVALILINDFGLSACRVTALGRGRFYPVDPVQARQSSAANPADRRIELEIRPVVKGDKVQQEQRARCVDRKGNQE